MEIKISVNPDCPDDVPQSLKFLSANRAFSALEEIRQDIFRPARKHGYQDIKINNLIKDFSEKHPELAVDVVYSFVADFIGALEDKYTEILEDNGLLGLVD